MRAFAGSAATALATAQTVEAEQLRMSIAGRGSGAWPLGPRAARRDAPGARRAAGASSPLPSSRLAPSSSEAPPSRRSEQIEIQITELQGLITELRPAALDDLGLEPALEDALRAHSRAPMA